MVWIPPHCERACGGITTSDACLGGSAIAEQWKRIEAVNTFFKAAQAGKATVITLETSPTFMPTSWVNFMKQRLYVLGVDCQHIAGGRIVVTSSPHAAESIARLVISAMEVANEHVKMVMRNLAWYERRKEFGAFA
jgi:hypothetical protein